MYMFYENIKKLIKQRAIWDFSCFKLFAWGSILAQPRNFHFLFLSDEGPMLETLDYTIRIGSTPTFLYFDLFLGTRLFELTNQLASSPEPPLPPLSTTVYVYKCITNICMLYRE